MGQQDTAVCPECGLSFAVTRYGRRIACPGCDEALDIQPDDPPEEGLSEEDWRQLIRGKIEWLTDAYFELLEGGFREAAAAVEEELARLKLFAHNRE